MVTTVQKWGNSQGMRLTKQILDDACIAVGDKVDVSARGGILVVTPVRRVRGRRNLEELMARIPKDYTPEEVSWGPPCGREVW